MFCSENNHVNKLLRFLLSSEEADDRAHSRFPKGSAFSNFNVHNDR